MFNLNIIAKATNTNTNLDVVPFGSYGTINITHFNNPVVMHNPITNGYSIVEKGNAFLSSPAEESYGGRYNEWDDSEDADEEPSTSADDAYVLDVYNELYKEDKLIQFLLKKLKEFNAKREARICITLAGGMFRDPILKCPIQDYDVFLSNDYFAKDFIIWFNDELANSEYRPLDLEEDNSYHSGLKSIKYVFDEDLNFPTLNIVAKSSVVSFNADISKLGVTLDSNGEVIEVFSEGIQAIRDRKVTLSLHVRDKEEYNSQTLHRYSRKLTMKPWAKEFTFELQVTGDVEYTEVWQRNDISEESFYVADTKPVETLLCLLEFGFFSVWKEGQAETFIKTVRNFQDSLFNEVLHLGPAVHFRLSTEDYLNLWLEGYIREGGAYDVIRAGHSSVSKAIMDGVKEEVCRYYGNIRGRAYANTIDLGWDIMSHMSLEAQELLVEGKKRLAFSLREGEGGYSSAVLRQYYRAIGFGKLLEAYDYPKNVFNADARVFLGKPGFSPKQAMLNNACRYTILDFSKVLEWSVVLGEASLLLGRYWITHTDLIREVNIPRNMVKVVATNQRLMSWVFEHELNIDWSVSKSPKVCIIKAIMIAYGVDENMSSTIYDNPTALQAIEFSKVNDNTNVVVSKSFPNKIYTSSCGKYVLEMLSKTSLDNLVIGEHTSCCQHLNGAGRTVCIDGWLDSHSINYVIKSVSSNTIYSHFWMWESQEGLLVLDSLEGRADKDLIEVTLSLVKVFIKDNLNVVIGNTGYGYTQELISSLGLSSSVKCPIPYTDYRYMDAEGGVFLTSDYEGRKGGNDQNLTTPFRPDINEEILDASYIQGIPF